QLATAVVRQRYGIVPSFGVEDFVYDGLHALEHDRAVPNRAQPTHVVPRECRVELGVDVVRERDRGGAVADIASDDVGESDRFAPEERPGPARIQGAVEDRARPDGRWD